MSAMLRQQQSIKHDPESGRFGDCYRTCVAMIMGQKPADVPHFCSGNAEDVSGIIALREWLKPQGYGVFQSIYPPDTEFSTLLRSLHVFSPGVPVIVTGMGGRGVNHCVVVLGGEVFCDPHSGTSDPEPFTGPARADGEEWWWVEVVAKIPGAEN